MCKQWPLVPFVMLTFAVSVDARTRSKPASDRTRSATELEALVRTSADMDLPDTLAIRRVQLQTLPKVSTRASALVEWRGTPRAGVQTTQVTFIEANQTATQVFATIQLADKKQVAIARHELPAGTMLTAEDVEFALIDTPGTPATASLIPGAQVVRSLAAGAPILRQDLKLAPPLARGTRVTIIVSIGAIEVTSSGQLERDSRPGDPVSVRLQSGQLVSGTLRDQNIVEITEGKR